MAGLGVPTLGRGGVVHKNTSVRFIATARLPSVGIGTATAAPHI